MPSGMPINTPIVDKGGMINVLWRKFFDQLQSISNPADAFDSIKQDATHVYTGVTRYSTDAEVIAGSNDASAITPDGLSAKIDTDSTLSSASNLLIPSQKAVKDYVDASSSSSTSTNITKLQITRALATGSNFTVTVSTYNYTKTGDNGDLRSMATEFNEDPQVGVFLNGVYQVKGTEAVWVSQFSFQLNQALDINDELIVIS
jgi:hypothetical protein